VGTAQSPQGPETGENRTSETGSDEESYPFPLQGVKMFTVGVKTKHFAPANKSRQVETAAV
jgi:hypothetical protein